MYRLRVDRILPLLCTGLILLFASQVSAQSNRGSQVDDWGESESRTRSEGRATTSGASTSGTARGLFTGDPIRGYRGFEGFYAQFGASVGEIEFDGNPDVDAGGGFTMTGGYRFFSWLSAEANVSYLGGGEIDGTNREVDFFSITIGPKLYPLGLLDEQPLPESVQPYALIGLGGGEYDVENTSLEEDTFIARFIFGLDFWFTDHLGAFMEGGYHVAADDDIDGTGLFSFGGQYRF